MASTSKALKCVDPCPRYLTPDDTHDVVFCLAKSTHAMSLRGHLRALCYESSVLVCPSFRGKGQPSASRDSVPTAAEARRRLKSRGSQLDMADELEKDRPFSRASAETRVSCWIVMMRSF